MAEIKYFIINCGADIQIAAYQCEPIYKHNHDYYPFSCWEVDFWDKLGIREGIKGESSSFPTNKEIGFEQYSNLNNIRDQLLEYCLSKVKNIYDSQSGNSLVNSPFGIYSEGPNSIGFIENPRDNVYKHTLISKTQFGWCVFINEGYEDLSVYNPYWSLDFDTIKLVKRIHQSEYEKGIESIRYSLTLIRDLVKIFGGLL